MATLLPIHPYSVCNEYLSNMQPASKYEWWRTKYFYCLSWYWVHSNLANQPGGFMELFRKINSISIWSVLFLGVQNNFCHWPSGPFLDMQLFLMVLKGLCRTPGLLLEQLNETQCIYSKSIRCNTHVVSSDLTIKPYSVLSFVESN